MSEVRKLPVFATAGEVLSGVTRHYFQLLFAAWPAVVFVLAAVLISCWQYYNAGVFQAYVSNNGGPDLEAILAAQRRLAATDVRLLSWASQLVLLVASAVAAVRWHRFVLLGEGADNFGGVTIMRKEDGAYVWATLKVFGVMAVGILALVLVGSVVALLKLPPNVNHLLVFPAMAFFVWLYLCVLRLTLALPDAALSGGGRLFAMYNASAGNGWRLLGLAMSIGFLLLAALMIVAFVLGKFAGALGISFATSPAVVVIAAVIYMGIYLYFVMTQVTMLSVAYREIIGLPPVPGTSTVAPDAPRIEPV